MPAPVAEFGSKPESSSRRTSPAEPNSSVAIQGGRLGGAASLSTGKAVLFTAGSARANAMIAQLAPIAESI